MTEESKQFWVETEDMLHFAEVLEESQLSNTIVGIDDDQIIVDVDYDEDKKRDLKFMMQLQKAADGDYEEGREDQDDSNDDEHEDDGN